MYHDGLEWTRCFCKLNFRSYQFRWLRRSGCKSWPPNAEAPTLAPVANQLFANCEPCISVKQAMNCEDLWNSATGIRFCMVLQYYAILRIENCLVISSRWLRIVIIQAMINVLQFHYSSNDQNLQFEWAHLFNCALLILDTWCCMMLPQLLEKFPFLEIVIVMISASRLRALLEGS